MFYGYHTWLEVLKQAKDDDYGTFMEVTNHHKE